MDDEGGLTLGGAGKEMSEYDSDLFGFPNLDAAEAYLRREGFRRAIYLTTPLIGLWERGRDEATALTFERGSGKGTAICLRLPIQ